MLPYVDTVDTQNKSTSYSLSRRLRWRVDQNLSSSFRPEVWQANYMLMLHALS